ncbi:hypothetical protein Vadar_005432 [Vaccinium darrowii]|uniref:Uncharacterized protein n=1 Tax=Vaccinium darrowii TaxID=229202 RepID=A0ACB7XG26_9ERIC|nr:hypothetical protein Vadar_005432 [Vaccinium darrowii]
MDEIFGEIIGCGFGSDSIMLILLRSAMDKAHENVESIDGSIELLSARSKFYELAMILVEGCSKLIEEKAEVPKTNREKMLSDLMESKDMVRGRLEELQIAMVEKDRELLERIENEWKLRQALDSKERELVSLRAKNEFGRTSSEGFDEGKEEGCIRELKHSVDQQVWSIKQKLEDERMSLTGGSEFPAGREEFEMTSENRFMRLEQKLVIEQMSSDIDGLKGTLDVAFGRMQHAEMRPLEKEWGWEIEKDTMLILIEGFMGNLKGIFEVELQKRTKHQLPSGLFNENWDQLIEEITCLHRELGDLCCSNEKEAKTVKSHESLELSTKIRRASSEPLPEHSLSEERRNEDKDGDVSHVAKMIQSHESIIRKQREELNRLKREMILREKEESLSSKRLKDPHNLERRIQEVVARLDNVIKWKGKIQEEKGKFSLGQDFVEEFGCDSICCRKQTCLNDEIRKLNQERDDLKLEIMIMEETYAILFKGLLKDLNIELEDYEIAITTKDDIFSFLLKEIVEEWKTGMDFDSIIKGERNKFPICKSFSRKHREVRAPQNFLENTIESKLKEDVCMVFLRETVKEWKMEVDAYDFENHIREEIHNFLVVEATKDSYKSPKESGKCSEEYGEENLIQTLDCLLKCVEVEEDLMLKASCEIKEHSANNDLVATECEEVDERDAIEWLLTEEENTFCSVSSKLEKALQQLFISKELLRELQDSLGYSVGEVGKVYEREKPRDNQIVQLNSSDANFLPLMALQKMFVDFESMVQQKLEMNFMRLKELEHHIYLLTQVVASVRKRESLYKNAFSRRCHDLKLAETEVDLLGDQVDVLVGLLEKIYLTLDQFSPVLLPHFRVFDILKLIKKEISGASTT